MRLSRACVPARANVSSRARTRADQMRTRALFLRRWSAVFDTMTKEKEQESAESISSREAMKMVHQMLDKMVSSVSSCYPPADTTASILTVLPPRVMRGVVERQVQHGVRGRHE